MIPGSTFYSEWHGHTRAHLAALLPHLRGSSSAGAARRLIILAGDSTLDNKAWVADAPRLSACCGVEAALSPANCVPDVAAALNAECAARGAGGRWACLNAAVEESLLCGRVRRDGTLALAQDAFAAAALQPGDVLVASAGGNDVVLAPALSTVAALAALLLFASDAALQDGSAWGMPTLVTLFRDEFQRYLRALCARARPALILACFVYYPSEAGSGWADAALWMMGYGRNPRRLQAVMRAVYRHATCRIAVEGVRVQPLPLYAVLDASPSGSGDYVARVEPSAAGGAKIARAVLDAVFAAEAGAATAAAEPRASSSAT